MGERRSEQERKEARGVGPRGGMLCVYDEATFFSVVDFFTFFYTK